MRFAYPMGQALFRGRGIYSPAPLFIPGLRLINAALTYFACVSCRRGFSSLAVIIQPHDGADRVSRAVLSGRAFTLDADGRAPECAIGGSAFVLSALVAHSFIIISHLIGIYLFSYKQQPSIIVHQLPKMYYSCNAGGVQRQQKT